MGVKFEDALDVRALDDGENWLVLEDFYYDTDVTLDGVPSRRIDIPKGFITDFASIPRPLWSVVGAPASGKYRKAAVVHDYLYRTKGLATRPEADAVLMEAMTFLEVGWPTRWTIYAGVRVGGENSYKGML